MLMMIYDSKGEPFEVRPALAKKLIIQHGWNASPPTTPAPQATVEQAVDDQTIHTVVHPEYPPSPLPTHAT
jgi:hypothetical protein